MEEGWEAWGRIWGQGWLYVPAAQVRAWRTPVEASSRNWVRVLWGGQFQPENQGISPGPGLICFHRPRAWEGHWAWRIQEHPDIDRFWAGEPCRQRFKGTEKLQRKQEVPSAMWPCVVFHLCPRPCLTGETIHSIYDGTLRECGNGGVRQVKGCLSSPHPHTPHSALSMDFSKCIRQVFHSFATQVKTQPKHHPSQKPSPTSWCHWFGYIPMFYCHSTYHIVP